MIRIILKAQAVLFGSSEVMNSPHLPRPEHPKPQFVRDRWLCMNGVWTFAFDFGRSGKDRGFVSSMGFDREIVVPFCPESILSGVAYQDFIPHMWYHRTFSVPDEWRGSRILLHFGAVDFETEVYLDGLFTGRHWGGSSSFVFDITASIIYGRAHHLVVHVNDDTRSGEQAGGKQAVDYSPAGCLYTRTTGIWQTVWLEAVPPQYLESCHFVSCLGTTTSLYVTPVFNLTTRNRSFRVTVSSPQDGVVAAGTQAAVNGIPLHLLLPGARLWSPQDPFLYDVRLEITDETGEIEDSVCSYMGLRCVHTEGNQFLLNNESIYQRLVLDQGYYPEGIWTAPSDEALKKDIELSLAAGFNGARLHQKVFEERFHYWAEKLGYLTWAESPNWGMDVKKEAAARNFLTEWREIVVRDRNHPSIIAWTTLNETWDLTDKKKHRRLHLDAYDLTRTLDSTRPVNNASGGCQVKTDLYCVHIYEQNPQLLLQTLRIHEGRLFCTLGEEEVPYEGQPYIVDEFGGIRWISDPSRMLSTSWGYGTDPLTLDDFYERLEGQIAALVSLDHISGFCYTQLTDVEQEQNGVYNCDRTSKFDNERIRTIIQSTPETLLARGVIKESADENSAA